MLSRLNHPIRCFRPSMGINMDIRNEPEYAFLDLADLDETTKNEILAIVRPNTSFDSLKLPWDIGEREYDLASEVTEGQVEDVSNQWQQYGMAESIPGYEGCVTTSPMIATTIPPGHPYGGTQMITVYGDSGFAGMGAPFPNSASGDPNVYPYVGGFQYGHPQAMYPTGTEMMNQQPSRENERRGGGRNRSGGGSGKRESYNRIMNSNNDIQNANYAVQGQHQYGPMVPMSHSSGTLYSFTPQGHPAAGTPIFMPAQTAAAYPQGPQLHHNSHAAYGHHPSNYQTHQHSPSNQKYRGQGQATYYNQESIKNPAQKHHDKRGGHQQDNCPTPPFRNSTNSETESPKRNYEKKVYVSNSNSANTEVRSNAVQNNSASRHTNNKKVTFSGNETKFENPEVAVVKEEITEIVVEKKECIPAAVTDNNSSAVSAGIKDKATQQKEYPAVVEEKIPVVKAQIEVSSPPRISKGVDNIVEKKETVVVVKTEKIQDETVPVKILETPIVSVNTNVAPAVSVAAVATPPTGKSWASIVLTGGPPGDSMKSMPPITRLPVARVVPVNNPPVSPVETVAPPKTSSKETASQNRNENVTPVAIRNNTETAAKAPESSPWTDTKVAAESPQPNNLNDPAVFRMGELLLKYQMDKQTVSLLPRGLTNRSNYCYINSILQALLACPPFYNLLMALPYPRNSGKSSSTPLIDNMARFVREFSPLAEGARMPRKDRSQKRGEETTVDVQFGVAFEPSYVYTMLKNTSCAGVFSVEGRQEDAEEFLSCLLNGISDEMLELMKLVNADSNDAAPAAADLNANHNNDEEGWKVMGPKNKGSITRCTEFGRTPLSDIFRGQLRSRVMRIQEESTDNVQPFFTLQLDIEKAESVEGALETLFGKDRVEGMTCSKTKQQIEAWKQVSLEELPVILILHLKWFDYKLDGCSKILKRVGFPIDLKLDPKKLLSPNVGKKLIRKQNQYKLFAVTYHDGKEASKGHYVTDAFHVGYGAWVRYDDSSVKGIYEMDVLNPSLPRVPYLLYYRRCDTIGNNPPNTPRTR